MSINVESTTDTKEAVIAALGDLAPKPVEDENPAPVAETISETAEASEASEESDESELAESAELEDAEAKPKKKGGFQKRIDKLTKKMSAIEQDREYWREQALRASLSKPAQEVAASDTKKILDPTRPKTEDFATHDEYVEALSDWKVEKKLSAERQAAREANVVSEQKAKLNTHAERVNKFRETHDDFDEVLEDVGQTQLSITVRDAFLDSENGPELMYELAKNPAELKRIIGLPPISAAMALGKIEAKLVSAKVDASEIEPKTSKAPAPVSPVRSRGAVVVKSIYDDSISQREFEKLRMEQIKKRRA